MKSSYFLSVVLSVVLSLYHFQADAHRFLDLDVQVMVNDRGNARVIEKRTYYIGNSGTEGYLKQYNLGVMEVGEFSVTDEQGESYREFTPWIEKASRDEKTGCCGIYKGDGGPELCWGIGTEGYHVYVLRYTLTRLVKSFDDYDGFNFKFFDAANPYPRHVKVTIAKQDGAFDKKDSRVWAFGFYGNIEVKDGKIVAETERRLQREHESVTVMSRFDKGVFHPVTTVKGTFRDKLLVPAFKGSSYSLEDYDANETEAAEASVTGAGYVVDDKSYFKETIDDLADTGGILLWLVSPIILLVAVIIGRADYVKDKQLKRLFGVTRVEVQQWHRDIPFEGNINCVRAVLDAVDGGKTARERQMGAYILRLVNSGKLHVVRRANENGDIERVIGVTNPGPPPLEKGKYLANHIAYLLHQFMWKAAGEDHVLQLNELDLLAHQSPVEHRKFVKQLKQGLDKLPFTKIESVTKDQANAVYGLKKFLEEFTLSSERHIEDVGLWREYLVFATLFGISERVMKELKTVWPVNLSDSLDEMLDTVSTSSLLTTSMDRAIVYVEKYETPAERAARLARERESRSSGGGGGSSYGGGGGSSGGGGSGIR